MANRFARYLETAPEAPTPSEAAPVAAEPKTNRFAKYVETPEQASGPAENLPVEFGKGLVKSIPNAVTGTADLIEGFLATPFYKEGEVNPIYAMGQQLAQNLGWRKDDPQPTYQPKSGAAIGSALSAVGANPNDYLPEAQTPEGRMAGMAGEGLGSALIPLPGGKTRGLAIAADMAKAGFSGAASGVASQAAQEYAPDEWKNIASLGAGLVGGVGGLGAAEVPGILTKGARKAASYIRPTIHSAGNIEGLAAERVARAVQDPAAAVAALDTDTASPVAGFQRTAGQASGDRGLQSLETAFSKRPEYKDDYRQRIDEQRTAALDGLRSIQDSGDVSAVSDFFRQRMAALENHADALYASSESKAKGQFDALGDRQAGDIGAQGRKAISDNLAKLKAEESALWKSIDPEGKVELAAKPLVDAMRRIYGEMSPEEMLSLSTREKELAGLIRGYGDSLPFSRFQALRSEISGAMREAKSFASPNLNAHRRLTQLRGAIEDAVSETIAGNPTLADRFVANAKEWYENHVNAPVETRASAVAGAPRTAEPVPPAVSGSPTAGSPAGRGLASPASDQGLPPNGVGAPKPEVVEPPLASVIAEAPPRTMMDAAAADRYAKATEATRNVKDTFSAKSAAPVPSMLRRPGNTYPFDMSDEKVAANLWKAGPEGASTIQSVLKAAGDSREARAAVEGAAVLSLKRLAGKDGTIDPAKLATWRAKHADALKLAPDLDKRFSSAAKATEEMARVGEASKVALDAVRKTSIGKLLGVTGPDVTNTIGSMLGKPDSVKSMRQLAAEARGNPDAMAGLQQAVVDHVLNKVMPQKDGIKANVLMDFISKNSTALSQVLSPDQMASLRAIGAEMKRAMKAADTRAPGGGSDTYENFMADAHFGDGNPTLLGVILSRAANLVAGAIGWLHSPLGAVAGWVSSALFQGARQAGMKKVSDLIAQAILDPELMKKLLMKAPKRKDTGSAMSVRQHLANIAKTNLLLAIGGQDQETEPRG